jgi:hypothetical protein
MAVFPMSKNRLIPLLALAMVGCSSTYHVVQYPTREADLYPLSQTREGVSVAVDEVRSGARSDRYFGADLTRQEILPVAVIVSNNGPHRVVLKPGDVLLHEGSEVIDPLPTEQVIALARGDRALQSKTQSEVAQYFDSLAFKETVLTPGESYKGVMFFPMPAVKKADRNFSALPLFADSRLQVIVGARDMETQTRYHFGPFSLTPLKDDE